MTSLCLRFGIANPCFPFLSFVLPRPVPPSATLLTCSTYSHRILMKPLPRRPRRPFLTPHHCVVPSGITSGLTALSIVHRCSTVPLSRYTCSPFSSPWLRHPLIAKRCRGYPALPPSVYQVPVLHVQPHFSAHPAICVPIRIESRARVAFAVTYTLRSWYRWSFAVS